jgi:Carboxypeptidase regulatory-like domain
MSKSILDRVSIGSSCQTDWEAMNGDQSHRYCDQCEKSVYNFSQLTRSQAEALIARTNGKLCARIERRPDGSILTADKSYTLPRFNQKFLRIASATMSAALSLAPVVAAKPVKNLPVLNFSQEQKVKAESKDTEKTARILGIVYDPAQAVIQNTQITLINEVTKNERKTTSTGDGTYEFALLEAGKYSLVFEALGFKKTIHTEIKIIVGQEMRQDATLSVGEATMGILITQDYREVQPESAPQGLSLTPREKQAERKHKKNLFKTIFSTFKKSKN